MNSQHSNEIERGVRFEFGSNWRAFLGDLNESKIQEAELSLSQMLAASSLDGKAFLDVGCGSGLFSLAARRLGARVLSFDYDPQSVACAESLKTSFFPSDPQWEIREGSALDKSFVLDLGQFDVVYSWGVLHHTGSMFEGLRNAAEPVRTGGLLFVAIYNDQGALSRFWSTVKRVYCSGSLGRVMVKLLFIPGFWIRAVAASILTHGNPWRYFWSYRSRRGMSVYRDWIDWLGGFPFEVAKPETILEFYRPMGFELVKLTTTNRMGCNEFVFKKLS